VAGREKRKRRKGRERRRQLPEPPQPVVDAAAGTTPVRKSKDDLAREQLVPLAEDERPVAVTIAAVVAGALVVGWVVALATEPSARASAPLAVLLGIAAYGMWRSRYWAVLGFQVVLAITLVNAILFLALRADAVLDVVIGLVIVAASGSLFWFLIRALARLQMPERRAPG
jgi:hypothetical protein